MGYTIREGISRDILARVMKDDVYKKQGTFIYRGKGLIKYGTWFGTPRHEVSKYGRVKVDIPNSMDEIRKEREK